MAEENTSPPLILSDETKGSPRPFIVRYKWLLICAVIIVGVLFVTNPSQTTHLKEVNEVVALRYQMARQTPGRADTTTTNWLIDIRFENYGLFSMTTAGSNLTLSLGFLGRVYTTNDIATVVETFTQKPTK